FCGKRIATPDGRAATHIREVAGATGMAITVENTHGFRAGDDLLLYDVQPGDNFTLPCWAHLDRLSDGHVRVQTNAPLTVLVQGGRHTVPPTRDTVLALPSSPRQ